MKKIGLIVLAGLWGFSVKAQEINQEAVPDKVKESFNEEYASAKDIEWQRGEEKGTFEADFSMNGEEMEATYDKSGKKKMVMTEIRRNELPQALRHTLNTEYREYDFDTFYRVEKEGKIKYKVEAEKDGKTEKMMFDESGKKIEKGNK